MLEKNSAIPFDYILVYVGLVHLQDSHTDLDMTRELIGKQMWSILQQKKFKKIIKTHHLKNWAHFEYIAKTFVCDVMQVV